MYKRNHVTIWNWIQKYHPKTDFIKTKKDFRIHSWWDLIEGWLWIHLALGRYRIRNQANSRTIHL